MRTKIALTVFGLLIFVVDQVSAQMNCRQPRPVSPCCCQPQTCCRCMPVWRYQPVDPCGQSMNICAQPTMFPVCSGAPVAVTRRMMAYENVVQPQPYPEVTAAPRQPTNYSGGGSLTDTIVITGNYNQQQYTNNEVLIRAIEGFIQETISKFFGSDFKFTVYEIDPVDTSSRFEAVNNSGSRWVILVNVGGGSFSFQISRRDNQGTLQGFTDTEKTTFENVNNDLDEYLGLHGQRRPSIVKTWTNKKGVQVSGEVSVLNGETVQFKRESDQKIFRVSLAIFCVEDQKLITNTLAGPQLAAK